MDKVAKYASGRNVLILFVVTQCVYAWMLLVSIPAVLAKAPDLVLFDMSPLGYSPDFAVKLLDGIGETGRKAYVTQQLPVDFAYPGLFAVTGALMLIWALGKSSQKQSRKYFLACIPIAAGVFDYLENVGILSMLVAYPTLPQWLVSTSSVFTILKSLMTVFFYVLLLYSFCAWGYGHMARPAPGRDAGG